MAAWRETSAECLRAAGRGSAANACMRLAGSVSQPCNSAFSTGVVPPAMEAMSGVSVLL